VLHDLQGLGSLTTIMGHFSEAWDRHASDIHACTSHTGVYLRYVYISQAMYEVQAYV
jgi:hypothetical protein